MNVLGANPLKAQPSRLNRVATVYLEKKGITFGRHVDQEAAEEDGHTRKSSFDPGTSLTKEEIEKSKKKASWQVRLRQQKLQRE